jgi:hypothetical protein
LKSISGKEKPRTIAATVLCGPRLAGAESGLFVRVKLGNAGRGSSTLAPKAAQSMTFCRLSPQSSERAKSVPDGFQNLGGSRTIRTKPFILLVGAAGLEPRPFQVAEVAGTRRVVSTALSL